MSRIVTLQLGRAIAATAVVIGHTLHEAEKWPHLADHLRWASTYVPFGKGVDVFFVISGFVMYYISRDRTGEPGYWRVFARNRIVRIVPVYWFYTAVMIGLLAAIPHAFDTASLDLGQILRSLFFLPGLTEARGNPILQLGWTLNYEMFFYALFAACIAAFATRCVPVLAGILVSLALLHPLLVDTIYPLKFWSRPLILDFAAGVGLAAVFARGVRLSRGQGLGLIACSLLLFLAIPHIGLSSGIEDVAYGVAATLFVAGLALGPEVAPRNPLIAGAVEVGDASYSLYLSHPFVLTAVFLTWQWVPALQVAGGWLYLAVTTAACLLASVIAYHAIERPLTTLARERRLVLPLRASRVR